MFKRENKKIEKIKLNKESLKKVLKIFKYLKPYKLAYLLGLIFLLLSSFVSLVFPMLIGEMVDASKKSIENIEFAHPSTLVIVGVKTARTVVEEEDEGGEEGEGAEGGEEGEKTAEEGEKKAEGDK